MQTIDRKQIQLIHIAKGKLGLDDAAYRETLRAFFQVESSTALSYELSCRTDRRDQKKHKGGGPCH